MKRHFIRCILYAILVAVLMVSCSQSAQPATPTSELAVEPTLTPSPPPPATLTPTSPPSLAVLLTPPGADTAQAGELQTALNDIITAAGLHWQVRQQLTSVDLTPAIRLVVALPPDPGLAALAATAPQIQFLAIGIQGLEATPNLSLVGAQGPRPDQQGFIAGYIAAMLTDDWRVGAITISDNVEGRAARSGFLNGVVYFCGLCMQAYPPFYDYPRYVELPAGATAAEWQAAANHMIDYYVGTVYIGPGAGDQGMLSTLVAAGIKLIGSGVPTENLGQNWVVSLNSDPLAQVQALVPQLLQGQGGQDLPLPLDFTQVNNTLLTPGKQNLASSVLADLLAGYIDPGVDLTTGENR